MLNYNTEEANKMLKQTDKNYCLIALVSFTSLVLQILLSKTLFFIYGMTFSLLLIPLAILGLGIGSAITKNNFLVKVSQKQLIFLYLVVTVLCVFCLTKFIITDLFKLYYASTKPAISAALRTYISIWPKQIIIWVLYNYYRMIYYFFILKILSMLIWPFIVLGAYFGRVYSEDKNLGLVFLSNGIGLTTGAFFVGMIYRFFGSPGGIFFLIFLLLIPLILVEKGKIKLLYIFALGVFLLISGLDLLRMDKPQTPGFHYFASGGKILITKYSEISRTDVVGVDGVYRIFTDGDAPTKITKIPDPKELYQTVERKKLEIPFSFRDYKNVLVIGAGGGVDILAAIKAGARRVVGVELNPITIQLMKRDFRQYSGNLYFHPNVEIINQEGRDYLRKTNEKFNLILLRGTDTGTTFSFLSSFTLEAYLYTEEAIKDYWRTLADDGCLIIRRTEPKIYHNIVVLQILQLYDLIKILGMKEHCVIIKEERKTLSPSEKDSNQYTFILFKHKVDPISISSFFDKSQEILYLPGNEDNIESIKKECEQRFYIHYLRDDCPAFYNFVKWQKNSITFIGIFFIIALILAIISVLSRTNFKKTMFYFMLGIGYIALELNLIGKSVLFFGNPTYSMQIVLASFLLFGGLGGYWAVKQKGNIKAFLLLLVIFSICSIFIYKWIYTIKISNQILRNGLAFLFMAPIGFFSVVPFSQALVKEEKKHIAYALDGIGTVMGTLLIGFIQRYWGFGPGFVIIALIYSLAILSL